MTKKLAWQRTFSGNVFHPFDPTPDEVFLNDIMWPLAKQCRYNGNVRNIHRGGRLIVLHYSVAEHCVLLARKLIEDFPDRPDLALQGLMHDAVEAYTGDMVLPIKQHLPEFKEVETDVERVVFEKFGLAFPMDPIIKEYDTRILLDEEAQALYPSDAKFGVQGPPLGIKLQFWDPESAHDEFMQMFGWLRNKMEQMGQPVGDAA